MATRPRRSDKEKEPVTSRMSAPLPRARLTPAPVGDRVIAGAIDLVTCGLVVAALGLLVGMFVDLTVLA